MTSEGQDRADALGWGWHPNRPKNLRPQPHPTTRSDRCFYLRQRAGTTEGYPGPLEARYALPESRRACDGGVAQGADGAKEVGRGRASHTHTSTLNFREFLFYALR